MRYTHRFADYAYAEYPVAGRAMSPRYKPDQCVLVSNAPLRPRSGVFINLKDGRTLVRELVEVSPERVTVRTYWPKEKIAVIASSRIAEMHRIIGAMDF